MKIVFETPRAKTEPARFSMAFLDTNVLVDLTRGNSAALEYVDHLPGHWFVSAITSLELIAGARNQREIAEIDLILPRIPRSRRTRTSPAALTT